MSLDTVHAVEAALQGARLTDREAARLKGAIEANTVQPSAREQLSAHLDRLRSVVGGDWLHDARRLVREALAEQAQDALKAADHARRAYDSGGDYSEAAEHVYEAVRQALLTD